MLHEQLHAAGLRVFPCGARWNEAKQKYDKWPATPPDPSTGKNENWKLTAGRLPADPALNWSSGILGLIVPAMVIIFDLDTQKGITRALIEQLLGCTLDWDKALIQNTISGGQHYAFYCPWEAIQGDNISGLEGFDTRCAGRGFICTGAGYTPVGFGVYAMLHPQALPHLPDVAREKLEKAPPPPPAAPAGPVSVEDEHVIDALRHISPDCSRSEWLRIGLALKHGYQHDEAQGEHIFDQWSAGEYGDDGTPANYVPEHIPHQWGSFKPDGGVTVATLFYRAIAGGWQPPAGMSVDTAAAFASDGPAATLDDYKLIVDRVRRECHDITYVQDIVDQINAAGCNGLQRAMLKVEMLRELDTKDKSVAGHLDALLRAEPPKQFTAPGMYGKEDYANAQLFLARSYPEGTLIQFDDEPYAFNGKVWERVQLGELQRRITIDTGMQGVNESRAQAALRTALRTLDRLERGRDTMPPHWIVFNNGVLDTDRGTLSPHDSGKHTTILHPYDYAPGAPCPTWHAFLQSTLDPDSILLLQEWLGYCMITENRHQKAMFLYGPQRAGKGTVGRVLKLLAGSENYTGGQLTSCVKDSFIDSLRFKTVLFMGDVPKKVDAARVNQVIEFIKSLTGGDEMTFHRMYVGSLTAVMPTRLTMAGNNVPHLFDDSGALANRLLVLVFNQSFLNREDKDLDAKLEAEVSGIASWAVEGLQRLNAQGRFTVPAASARESEYIQENYSPMLRFTQECCEFKQGATVDRRTMYEVYRAWVLNSGEDLMKERVFVGAIKETCLGNGVTFDPRNKTFTGVTVRGNVPSIADRAFQPELVKK